MIRLNMNDGISDEARAMLESLPHLRENPEGMLEEAVEMGLVSGVLTEDHEEAPEEVCEAVETVEPTLEMLAGQKALAAALQGSGLSASMLKRDGNGALLSAMIQQHQGIRRSVSDVPKKVTSAVKLKLKAKRQAQRKARRASR